MKSISLTLLFFVSCIHTNQEILLSGSITQKGRDYTIETPFSICFSKELEIPLEPFAAKNKLFPMALSLSRSQISNQFQASLLVYTPNGKKCKIVASKTVSLSSTDLNQLSLDPRTTVTFMSKIIS